MTTQNKAPTTALTATEAANKTSKSGLQRHYSKSLPPQHVKITNHLAIAGNSLTTYETAEKGWQHLPTKLSEITHTTGIIFDKERLPDRFYRYTMPAEARKQWRAICRGRKA